MPITLRDGEMIIDTRTVFYHPPGRAKVNGKLTVTNQRIAFAKLDVTLVGMLGDNVAQGGLVIEKSAITGITVERKLFSKKATITLADGSAHVLDFGAMNIDECVAAMEAR